MLPMRFKQAWEDLGEIDPLWAIISAPGYRFGRWDLAEFFETGVAEVDSLLAHAERLGHPLGHDAALDFGCGVGRVTRALARRFNRCVGVDISATMIRRARELNAGLPGCEFVVNAVDDLRVFPDSSFDLVYTHWVLMHLPRRATIEAYVAELLRTLRPGGLLVFQLPDRVSPLYRMDPRPRLYTWLRALGIHGRFLYERLNLVPIQMTGVPERDMAAFVRDRGARILEVDRATEAGGVENRIYYVTRGEG